MRKRESVRKRERVEKERELSKREREYLFLKGMTGALVPFSYLARMCFSTNREIFYFSKNLPGANVIKHFTAVSYEFLQ